MRTTSESCHAELDDKKQIKDLKCREFATVAGQVADENANRQIIKKSGSESVDTYIRRIDATICGESDVKGSMLERYEKSKKICDTAANDYNDLLNSCTSKEHDYRNKQEECDTLQEKMDQAACMRAVLVKDSCESYAECFVS